MVGIGGGWGSGLLVAGLEQRLRFVVMALALLALGYVLARLNYFNQRLDVEERLRVLLLLPKRLSLTRERPQWPKAGYLAMAAAAVLAAGSLAWSWHVVPGLAPQPWPRLRGRRPPCSRRRRSASVHLPAGTDR